MENIIPFVIMPKIENLNVVPLKGASDFGERFINSKYGRPYRYKNRKARTNFRSSNKKKIHQYL